MRRGVDGMRLKIAVELGLGFAMLIDRGGAGGARLGLGWPDNHVITNLCEDVAEWSLDRWSFRRGDRLFF